MYSLSNAVVISGYENRLSTSRMLQFGMLVQPPLILYSQFDHMNVFHAMLLP